MHVEQCYATMRDGSAGRKPAGADTRKSAGVILSAALKRAVELRLIPFNPAGEVKKARPVAREMAFMTQAQAKRFREAAVKNQNYALYAVALGTGARQGELLALTWADVDFDRGTIEIRRALARVKGKAVVKEPKSRASRRSVTLPVFAREALREHREQALKAGRITGPVFCTRSMGYLDRKDVLRAFRTIVARANAEERERAEKAQTQHDLIPDALRLHDLRHTHATGLIAAGSSIKAISRRLGHSNITVTLNVYVHLLSDDDSRLASQADTLFR